MASSNNNQGVVVGRITIYTHGYCGCHIYCQAVQFPSQNNRIELHHVIEHDEAEDAPGCKCRRNPDPQQEIRNDQALKNYITRLNVHGSEMVSIFAGLKLNQVTRPQYNLPWDNERKVWQF
ncbi:hypothetical protein GQX73_g5470 [Xylaria multiplex]|uniref:Uncharacterized protein n=1 Tax=Xylaria multiplex TaxID=323545 RepID=A0A7C8IWL6_9PEZI|nr:hypothetical protein GQX73_g5470 [Xylaria multiplex]